MSDQHKNFAYSTVATAPSPATSGTSLVVAAGDGAKFPTVPFNATVWPVSAQPTTANAEIVRVTAISTDTLTITRMQEGTSARTVVIGDQIAATVTAKTLTDAELNVYVTDQDKTIPATTQVIFDDYLEVAASFFYELSTDAILMIGDFGTPLPLPDQNANIFVTVSNELVPSNSEIVFSDFYELSAPFTTEVATNGFMQLGTTQDAGSASPFLPGYEIGYDQITANVTVASATEASGTIVISCNPHFFDGGPVIATFDSPSVSPANNDDIIISFFEGSTQITRLAFVQAQNATAGAPFIPVQQSYRFTPTAGLHAYTVTAVKGATNGTIFAGAGGTGAQAPTFIRFTKV